MPQQGMRLINIRGIMIECIEHYYIPLVARSGDVMVKLLVCGARETGFEPGSRRNDCIYWLSPSTTSLI